MSFKEPEHSFEIDFDSEHGTSLTDPCKPLLIYWNRNCSSKLANRGDWLFLFIPVIIILGVFVTPFLLVDFLVSETSAKSLILPLSMLTMLIMIIALVQFFIAKAAINFDVSKSMKPIIEIRPQGISIHCPGRNFDSIPWHAIEKVEAKTLYGWRMLRIIPKDPEYLLQFESEDNFISSNRYPSHLTLALKCKKQKGIFHFLHSREISIDIPEEWLNQSTEDLIEFINVRITYYLKLEETSSKLFNDGKL